MPNTKAKKHGGKKRNTKRKGPTTAQTACRHTLYQNAVQCVEAEIDFVQETYKAIRGKEAVSLREDFCGTANTSCEWVKRGKNNAAIGVDLDPEVLRWGIEHNIGALTLEQQGRIRVLEQCVMEVQTAPIDAVLAMNFSYWLFKERTTLRRYFQRVRDSLADDGVFFLDAYGGYDAPRELEERRECEGDFEYIWEQAAFDPISGDMDCKIHFEFPDGSAMRDAFLYHWRLWTMPEIRELLDEAGFKKTTVYWEGADENGEGDGVFTPTTRGDADAGWIAYITAEK